MSLNKTDVEKIAHLARLEIAAQDIPAYVTNLSNILDLVEQMNAVDTEGVTPMAHPLDTSQRLREDEVTEVNQRERFQNIAPQVEAGLYLTAGTNVLLPDGAVVAARELSGVDGLLFIRNSQTGVVEARPAGGSRWEGLNTALHAN